MHSTVSDGQYVSCVPTASTQTPTSGIVLPSTTTKLTDFNLWPDATTDPADTPMLSSKAQNSTPAIQLGTPPVTQGTEKPWLNVEPLKPTPWGKDHCL